MPLSWPTWSLDGLFANRPQVRVNQVGYLPTGAKRGTLIVDDPEPVSFAVRDASGATVMRGLSKPWPVRPEPTSGLSVHVLDFSALRAVGGPFRIEARNLLSHRFPIGRPYAALARDALGFFYRQRSGYRIDRARAPGYERPAGHAGRPPNQGDLAVPCWSGPAAESLYPGWSDGGRYDVSGGWYDAGDFGKYVVSGGIAVWQLLNTVDLLRRLDREARTTREQQRAVLEECRWQLDWLVRMQVPAGRPLAGTAFHRVHGTEWSPLPGWPHEDPTRRVLHRPSTAATLHLAATAAQGARLFADTDRDYADRLLRVARTAYRAAETHPELLAPDDQGVFGGGPYGDTDVGDDFYWAAAELWLATDDGSFRADVLDSAQHRADVFRPAGFDFEAVAGPARLDLAAGRRGLPGESEVRGSVMAAADRLLAIQRDQPWAQPYAPPAGWDWGSNGRLLNNLVVLATAHLVSGERRYRDGVVEGVDYLFGRNALGQSYVAGYGVDYSRHLRTRQYGQDLDPAFPPPPRGAVAGGPNSTPAAGFYYDPRLTGLPPQLCYLDEPTSEVTNDVCIRWNAPLVFIATYLDLVAEDDEGSAFD